MGIKTSHINSRNNAYTTIDVVDSNSKTNTNSNSDDGNDDAIAIMIAHMVSMVIPTC